MTTSNANRVMYLFRVVLLSAFASGNAAAEMIPFSPPQFLEAGPRPGDIVIEDFNSDGRPDFAVTNSGVEDSELGISVLLNVGNASFAPPIRYLVGTSTRAIGAGDVDGDGDVDLTVGLMFESALLAILKNEGDGTFSGPILTGSGDFISFNCRTHDLDDDDDIDVVLGLAGPGVVAIFRNAGDGTFPTMDTYTSESPAYTSDLAVTDLDGDQDIDLATVRTLSSDLPSILRNRGDGTFDSPEPFYSEAFAQFALDSGDVDRDGDPDLVLVGSGNRINVFLNDGTGTLTFSNWYPLGSFTSLGANFLLADLDADGAPEAIFPEVNGISVLVLRNDGAGGFAVPDEYSAGATPGTPMSADLDGDGDSDLIAGRSSSNQIAVFWSQVSTATEASSITSNADAAILSAWPNPTRHDTVISYELADAGVVRLTLHDVSGRLVRVLVDRIEKAGRHSVTWSGRGDVGNLVASGRYIVALQGHAVATVTVPLIFLR